MPNIEYWFQPQFLFDIPTVQSEITNLRPLVPNLRRLLVILDPRYIFHMWIYPKEDIFGVDIAEIIDNPAKDAEIAERIRERLQGVFDSGDVQVHVERRLFCWGSPLKEKPVANVLMY
jgi:hypothetical protein